MPNLDSVTFVGLMLLAIIVVGWFALGTQANVRKGDRVLKWLREGLPIIGEKTTMHWMGSTALQLKIAKAKNPYRNTETLFVFEPRDVVILWALSRLQGRRDVMIFRGTLTAAPNFELEVFDPKGWTTSHLTRDVQKKNWTRLDWVEQPALQVYYSGNAGATAAKNLTALAARTGGTLMRLSIHRDVPNIEAHWLMPNFETTRARELFSNLRELGEQALRG